MDIIVRRAAVGDSAGMGEIHVAAWRFAYPDVMPADFLSRLSAKRSAVGWADSIRRFEAGEPDLPVTMVAERDEALVAMTCFGSNRAKQNEDDATGELWMLNAHPHSFGTGAATALHARAVAELGALGHRRAVLWVVEQNPRARRFYEREGWHPDGLRRTETIGGADVAEVRYERELQRSSG